MERDLSCRKVIGGQRITDELLQKVGPEHAVASRDEVDGQAQRILLEDARRAKVAPDGLEFRDARQVWLEGDERTVEGAHACAHNH